MRITTEQQFLIYNLTYLMMAVKVETCSVKVPNSLEVIIQYVG
jgi:hypothetical protein